MALKFLNKKGWHTGSLRNIENVWKAEQKHEAEQKKLEELRKQILEERERSEFRLLQEQAGLVPKQERLEFLYDSGLAVGKGNSSGGFKALESSTLKTDSGTAAPSSASSSSAKQPSVPGALFEEKPQSANDTWRKLKSDPLLLIRQREQEALTRVKNNPIQMSMIRKSVEAAKDKKKRRDQDDDDAPRRKHRHKKKHEKQSSSKHHSGSENAGSLKEKRRKSSGHKASYTRSQSSEELSNGAEERKRISERYKYEERRSSYSTAKKGKEIENDDFQHEGAYSGRRRLEPCSLNLQEKSEGKFARSSVEDSSDTVRRSEEMKRRRKPVELSEEERAARLKEMQMDAELHEEQRWKRLKKAEENDAEEAVRAGGGGGATKGSNFLDAVKKSVYGTDKGGLSTIEESVRRRTHYLQGRSEATERNAFRR